MFGSNTEAAVARFQREAGLLVDGVVGRQTMAALKEPGVSPAACSRGRGKARCGAEGRSARLEAGGGTDAHRGRPTDDGRRAAGAEQGAEPLTGQAAGQRRKPRQVGDNYIVVFRRSVDSVREKTAELERDEGFRSRFRYGRALKGFAGPLSARQVRELRTDSEVAFVSPDRPVKASNLVPLASGDSAPTGVRRVGAATATRSRQASTARVAVLDTGVDLAHPDLDAVQGKSCVGGSSAQDDHGHGTHVAGTIAAKNNGSGVVGVAPGTKVDAVKVLDSAGSGTLSQVICGIDWVTATRKDADQSNDIAVANLSLGGVGVPVGECATTTDPMHKAVCASTAAGVTYVVAAGNDGRDFDNALTPDTPAAYPEALTVSAMSDSDGKPGAVGGAPSCRTSEADDSYASFSNYARTRGGEAHTLAAPGVCVRSTLPGGGHGRMSGTSMAAPHISGAVALCLGEGGESGPCTGMTPKQIVDLMRADAERYTGASPAYGFSGDPTRPSPERYLGYLQFAGTDADTAAPAQPAPPAADAPAGQAPPTTAPGPQATRPRADTPRPGGRSSSDTSPPVLRLPDKSVVKARRTLRLVVSCPAEACAVTVSGAVRVPSAGDAGKVFKFKLRKVTARLPKGARVTLELKQSQKGFTAARGALKRRKRVTARISVRARDDVANSITRTLRVRLKR